MRFSKPIDAIDEQDLLNLVNDGVSERKTLEFKRDLPGNSDRDKKEFLADVSSFANTIGGYLFFGIDEVGGVPTEVCGLGDIDPDAEKSRLENILRDNIDPRLPGVSIEAISVEESHVIAIHVPRSWSRPHVVSYGNHWRFYARNSAGKYPLDVDELRAVFSLVEDAATRTRRFRDQRIAEIVAGEAPLPLPGNTNTWLVLHLVPFSIGDPGVHFDVASLEQHSNGIRPIYAGGWNHRHNFDGFLVYASSDRAVSYVQFFRNGSVEVLTTTLLRQGIIPSYEYERAILDATRSYLQTQERLGVSPPIAVMLALMGVAGYRLMTSGALVRPYEERPIERNDLILPPVLLERFDDDLSARLRPAFDTVWNAAGWPRSMNYNDAGKWMG